MLVRLWLFGHRMPLRRLVIELAQFRFQENGFCRWRPISCVCTLDAHICSRYIPPIPAHRGRLPEAFGWRSGDGGACGCTSHVQPREAPGHRPPYYEGCLQWLRGPDERRGNLPGSRGMKVPGPVLEAHGPEVPNRRGGAPEGDALNAFERAGRKAGDHEVRLSALRLPQSGRPKTPSGGAGLRQGEQDPVRGARSRSGDFAGTRRAERKRLVPRLSQEMRIRRRTCRDRKEEARCRSTTNCNCSWFNRNL